MAISDYEHALFVLHEYRIAEAKTPSILATNDKAAEIEIDTALNEADADALADAILADNVNPRLHEVDIEGLLWLDNFIGGPPSWLCTFAHDAVNGDTTKTISTTVNFESGVSTIEVRG